MIYTITFNPALDINGDVESLIPNEKNYVKNEKHTPGGNGINSGVIAHRLGSKVMLTGFLGGANGDEIINLLDPNDIKHNFVKISENTRMNLTINNLLSHQQTRLSFAGPSIKAGELNQLLDKLKKVGADDIVILGGSLPPGISASFIVKLIKKIKEKKAFCIVDMPGSILKKVIKAKPDFIKPNLTEFQELVGCNLKTIKDIMPYANNVLKYVPIICLSSIEGGALLITKEDIWYGRIPKIKIKSTVGAGDSMVGAIANKIDLDNIYSNDDLLRTGLAASCATLAEKGLTLGSKKDIKKFYPQILIKKIL